MIRLPDNLSTKDFIDSRELAEILGIHVDSVYRWNMKGSAPELKRVKIGGKTYFAVSSLTNILK